MNNRKLYLPVENATKKTDVLNEESKQRSQLASNRTDLAALRTEMANKRTVLAYVRTAITIASLAKSQEDSAIAVVGIVFISIALFDYFNTYNIIRNGEWDLTGFANTFRFITQFTPIFVAIIAFVVLGYNV